MSDQNLKGFKLCKEDADNELPDCTVESRGAGLKTMYRTSENLCFILDFPRPPNLKNNFLESDVFGSTLRNFQFTEE